MNTQRCMTMLTLAALFGCTAGANPTDRPIDGTPTSGAGGDTPTPQGGAGGGDEPLICELPREDCDGDPANGCEADLDDDWTNCGSCGHDCLGGACVDGVCDAHLLGSMEGALPIAVDEHHVYTCSSLGGPPQQAFPTYITRIDKNGNDPEVVLDMGALGAAVFCVDLELDDTHAYALDNNGQVFAAPKIMPSQAAGIAFPTLGAVVAFTLDDTYLYFVEEDGTAPDGLQRIDKSGSGTPDALATTTGCTTSDIAVHDGFVYWLCNGDAGRLERAPIGGGDVEELATDMNGPLALTFGDGHVFFTTFGEQQDPVTPGAVYRMSLTTFDPPEALAVDLLHPTGITVLDGLLYWVENRGTLWRATLSGGNATTRYDLSDVPCTDTVCLEPNFFMLRNDGNALYWNDLRGSGFRSGVFRRLVP